jgi:hypothetical protein
LCWFVFAVEVKVVDPTCVSGDADIASEELPAHHNCGDKIADARALARLRLALAAALSSVVISPWMSHGICCSGKSNHSLMFLPILSIHALLSLGFDFPNDFVPVRNADLSRHILRKNRNRIVGICSLF